MDVRDIIDRNPVSAHAFVNVGNPMIRRGPAPEVRHTLQDAVSFQTIEQLGCLLLRPVCGCRILSALRPRPQREHDAAYR
jgi:hypothetical protein